jgi:hypothetical protein
MKRVGNIALNVFLVFACGLTCFNMIQSYRAREQADRAREQAKVMSTMFGSPTVGSSFGLSGIDWDKQRKGTLVFGISTRCHFCTQSAPQFKQILASIKPGIAVMALAPEPVEQVRQYLDNLGLVISDVRQASPAAVGIQYTPTLIFINRKGLVERVWRGALSSQREQEIVEFTSKIG